MSKLTWIENSNRAILESNKLMSKISKAKKNYQGAILVGNSETNIANHYQELQKAITRLEGFRKACDIFSR